MDQAWWNTPVETILNDRLGCVVQGRKVGKQIEEGIARKSDLIDSGKNYRVVSWVCNNSTESDALQGRIEAFLQQRGLLPHFCQRRFDSFASCYCREISKAHDGSSR